MARSPDAQLARRLNGTLTLLKRLSSPAETVTALMRRYRVSRRQAYRYVHQAHAAGERIPIPERTVSFTVKTPFTLARRFRRLARSTGESLSALVTRALEGFLQREGHG